MKAMGTLPSPLQVARNHNLVYEALYQQVDPAGSDHVGAVEAAAFLKRSGLPDGILSKIWDLSDPFGKGFLDKKGFFVALKLIALTQNGKDLSMANISLDVPPPKMQTSGRNSPAVDWTLKPSEYKKYEEMFISLGPMNNKLPGQKVKPVMLNSKLPLDVLGKIWDLSDTDQDGFLSKEEFVLAMHLIYRALENVPVPSVLPPELTAILRKRNSLTSIGVPVLPEVLPPSIDNSILVNDIRRSSTPSAEFVNKTTWVVGASDKAKYDEMFHALDKDCDGFVTGPDIKDTLLQTGVSQPVLAHIWNLCDIKQSGKLNSEQFALAMYLIYQKMQGNEVPAALLPEMVPPTLRPKPSADGIQDMSALVMLGDQESSGNKELDLISKEIKELHEEKMSLEKDIAQKEADVKIKNGELKNLQNELDALETMLKQLEVQKGEARKRLSDLDKQKGSIDLMLCDVSSGVEDETNQVEAIKKQLEEQESSVESQEQELTTKREELNEMKQEEMKLETQINDGRNQLETLTSTLQGTQLQISQMKLKIDQMQEQHRLMTDTIQQLDVALNSGDVKSISEFTLTAITPLPETPVTDFSPEIEVKNEPNPPIPVDDFKEDPFAGKDPFSETNGFTSDPFAGDNPFKSDPFVENSANTQGTFSSDPFDEVFGITQSNSKDDPFQGSDPFGGFSATAVVSTAKSDPFDPFGLSSNPSSQSPVMDSNSDPFGADPFGPTAVTPPQPESPTPALPPKKSKAPPPRPAPPKVSSSTAVKSGPTRAAPAPPLPPAANSDPFRMADSSASSPPFSDLFSQPASKAADAFDPFSSTDGVNIQANFANFADFDNLK